MPINRIESASPLVPPTTQGVNMPARIESPDVPDVAEIEEPEIAREERIAILVAGVNYPRVDQNNLLDPKKHRTYFRFAENYRDYLLANSVVDRVFLMDFLLGQVRAFRKGGTKEGDRMRPLCDPLVIHNYRYLHDNKFKFKPAPPNSPALKLRRLYYTGMHELALKLSSDEKADVPEADYVKERGQRFAKERSLSVSHVYELIRRSYSGSIKEVHFFGHAFLEGPIIVNTPGDNKKEYDKDARTSDFTNSELARVFDAQQLPHFQAAFTSNARLTVWGCEDNQTAKDLITHARAKAKAGKSMSDELDKLKEIIKKTYAAKLASTSGKTVLSALPGTYSVHEGETNNDTSPHKYEPTLMHIHMNDCESILEFYRKNLSISFATDGPYKGHPTFGRGYAIYNP